MGNSSAPAPAAHVRSFPMYLVKVRDFLQMDGPALPHGILRERGLLHQWCPGMFTIFVSHQWLGTAHPDPSGQQLAILRTALGRMIEGSLQVQQDLTSSTPAYRLVGPAHSLTSQTRQQIADGFLFLDWFAIPQITARLPGMNEDATKSEAAQAVQSIPAYVEAADLFIALVPELLHADTGLPCNYASWLSRGWCRAELWCRLLSSKQDTSVVVAYSANEAEFMLPLDWQRHLIADGSFTVESDRATVVRLGEVALESKLRTLQAAGPMSQYRFYLASRPRLLGQKQEDLTPDRFLEYFQFDSLASAIAESGMNGLMCAVLSGNVGMIHVLAEHKADVNYRLPDLSELGYYATQTLLMVAAKSYQAPSVLAALISLRADVTALSRAGFGAIFFSRSAEQVELLLSARAALHPTLFNGVAARASSETVSALLRARCEVSNRVAYGALHGVTLLARGNPHKYENAKLLLAHRADPNHRARPNLKYLLGLECKLASWIVDIYGYETCSTMARTGASLAGLTPLGAAALTGDSQLVGLLLSARAEISQNDRGDLPHELAAACGHTHLLPLLETMHV
ncbi:unnamed protein product [Effrenium voratum]|uniref:Uncharacterized protein n=1 Tax=Effrenium voratum TaxID=2562239 RepID=A0AA36HNC6_9DINO|nr:unnamed protein product [Effrenium voratum]